MCAYTLCVASVLASWLHMPTSNTPTQRQEYLARGYSSLSLSVGIGVGRTTCGTTSLPTGPATSTRTKVECRCKEHILRTHRAREYHTYRYSLLSTVVLGIASEVHSSCGQHGYVLQECGVVAASLHTTVLRILRAHGTNVWYHV